MVPCKDCSNYVFRVKWGPARGLHQFHIATSRTALIFGMQHDLVVIYRVCQKNLAWKWSPARGLVDFFNLLIKNHKASSFDIWYVTSSSVLLQDCSNYVPMVKKGPARGGGAFGINIEYYREIFTKSSCKILQGLEQWCLVCNIIQWSSDKGLNWDIWPMSQVSDTMPSEHSCLYLFLYFLNFTLICLLEISLWYNVL